MKTFKAVDSIKAARAIAMLLALALCLTALAACGGGSESGSGGDGGNNSAPKLSGKYTFVSMTEDGDTYEAAQVIEMGLNPDEFYVEFLDGEKFKMSAFDEMEEGTYKLEGNTVTLTVEDEPTTGTIDGNKITVTLGEAKMVFEKKS